MVGEPSRSKQDVLEGLTKQYGRLVGLCEGLGVEAGHLNTGKVVPEQLDSLIDRSVKPVNNGNRADCD